MIKRLDFFSILIINIYLSLFIIIFSDRTRDGTEIFFKQKKEKTAEFGNIIISVSAVSFFVAGMMVLFIFCPERF